MIHSRKLNKAQEAFEYELENAKTWDHPIYNENHAKWKLNSWILGRISQNCYRVIFEEFCG